MPPSARLSTGAVVTTATGHLATPETRAADPAEVESLLRRIGVALEPRLDLLVEEFYGRLSALPGVQEILARLSPREVAHLEARQADHLRMLLGPDTDVVAAARRASRSRHIGRVHAMVGVEMSSYVEALADHQRTLAREIARVPGLAEDPAAYLVAQERLSEDLHGTLLGYRDVDSTRSRVMMQVGQVVSEAQTVSDLARDLMDTLASLHGLTIAMWGRPDHEGVFQFEFGSGHGFEAFMDFAAESPVPVISTSGADARGLGPGGRAWRSGQIVCADSFVLDDSMDPWRPVAERFGWRSVAAVPLNDDHGRPLALISLKASWPGFFVGEGPRALLEQVKQLAERTLTELESTPKLASGFSGFAERRTHHAGLESGAVQMHFQPVVDLPSGRLTSVEALARMRVDGGVVGPAAFLPAFGDDELLRLFEIGLDQSLAALLDWDAAGLRTRVSVNLPVISTVDQRYVRTVRDALARTGVDPGRLTLELLETGATDDGLRHRRAALDVFREIGVRLAQDDLGSGHSSLLRLRHFAFDDVKIDQSLVRGTDLAPGAALHFIEPINDIAHSLGLHVVIEGLETDGLIEAAAQLGVDAGQGYAIARPMPAAELVAWQRGYRLDLDLARPVTGLGALGAHVAWEHRLSVLGQHPAREQLLGIESCMLTAYAAAHPDREQLEAAHLALHDAARLGRGTPSHRLAWERLAVLAGEGRPS